MTLHPDMSRPVATTGDIVPDLLYTLTIPDVAQRYLDAGFPKNPRTIQRYAAAGKIRAQKQMTATGELYLINPDSVDLHITELRQMEAQARLVAAGRDMARPVATPFSATTTAQVQSRQASTSPRPVAAGPDLSSYVANAFEPFQAATIDDIPRHGDSTTSGVAAETTDDDASEVAAGRDMPRQVESGGRANPATGHDTSRLVAPSPVGDDRYVKLLERENEFLREQVEVKDVQIKELTERSRETNALFGRLQTMLQPLLGTGRPDGRGHPHDLAGS